MDITFRQTSLKDAITVVHLRQKVWDATYRGIYPDKMIDEFDYDWHLEAEQKRMRNPEFRCYLVLDGKTAVGYFSYGRIASDYWKDFQFRLHSLYLLPEYQSNGIGKAIFSHVRQACLNAGYDRMCLDCSPHNKNAMGFYLHVGGTIVQEDTGHENREEDGVTIGYTFR